MNDSERKERLSWRRRFRESPIGRLIRSRVVSFIFIGGGLTLFGAIFLRIAKFEWHWDTDAANVVQAVISIIANFILNYLFTWSDARFLAFYKNVGRFVIAKGCTLATNAALFAFGEWAFINLFGLSWWIFTSDSAAYWFSTGIITLLNYPIMDTFVFGKGSFVGDAKNLFARLGRWGTLPVRIFKRWRKD